MPDHAEWDRIATSAQFQELLARKKAFIFPVFLFFLVYYLLLPILVGWAPRLMSNRVFGTDSSLPVRASDIGEVHFLASHDPIADKAHSNPEEAAINGGIMMRYILFFATLV